MLLAAIDWSTFALALTGIVLSLAALGWQWYSVVFIEGSRVSVELARGMRGVGAVVTFPADAPAWHVGWAREQGYGEPVYAITVHNRGRGSTSIAKIGLAFSDGGGFTLAPDQPALPCRVHGEHDETWYVPAEAVARYAQTSSQIWPDKARDMTVRGRAILGGSGKAIVSKERFRALGDFVEQTESGSGETANA